MNAISPPPKPRVRVPSNGKGWWTADSFVNFAANIGYGTQNLTAGSQYTLSPISRNHFQLEMMYRGSWLVRQIVDSVAEDMTRAGVQLDTVMGPDDEAAMMEYWGALQLWQDLQRTLKWARLYGGALGIIMIDGQNPEKPLDVTRVGPDQFKGLLVVDRWMVNPDLQDTVQALGPDFGLPRWYTIIGDTHSIPGLKVHYSRVIRFEGADLPYWQKMTENMWGLSVIEPMWDRMIAFDSATNGVAQLVYKAHLRTLSVERLRELIAGGGTAYQAFLEQIGLIRLLQSNEGMTILDASDKFETHQYTFAGLSDVLMQFGQQLSGAAQIPLVRLFGQSPAGMNATGESDIRNYYDMINAQQESRLRRPLKLLFEIVCRSKFGRPLPTGFNFRFRPLWQLQEKEKSDVASGITATVIQVHEAGLISDQMALKELREQSPMTGVFGNITDEDIENANDVPAPPPEMGGMTGEPAAEPPGPDLGNGPGPGRPAPSMVPGQPGASAGNRKKLESAQSASRGAPDGAVGSLEDDAARRGMGTRLSAVRRALGHAPVNGHDTVNGQGIPDLVERVRRGRQTRLMARTDAPISPMTRGQRVRSILYVRDDWNETQHPRGQPGNKGEFAKTPGGGGGQTTHAPAKRAPVELQPKALFAPEEIEHLPKSAVQPVADEQAMYEKSEQALEELDKWLNKGKGVAIQMGCKHMDVPPEQADFSEPGKMLFIAPLKSPGRAKEKVMQDYGGDWSKLTDVTRCTIAVDTMNEVQEVVHKLKQSGMTLASVPADRFAKPTSVGYRDLMLKVRFPSGMVGELQVHLKGVLKAKNLGHKFYENLRKLEGKPPQSWTDEERKVWEHNFAASKHLYDQAWNQSVHSGDAALNRGGYEIYEHDGARFRRSGPVGPVTEVWHEGKGWVPYEGDGVAPVLYGDRINGAPTSDRVRKTLYNRDAPPPFKESDHPRGQPGNKGEFVKGGGAAKHVPASKVEGKHATASGEPLPPHITKLRIPPAWTDVTYSPDPDAALQATGKDAKGRRQSIYSAEHSAKQAAEKFARVKELDEKIESIRQENENARKDKATRDAADAMALIMSTGIRPGSETDTKADTQGYGATTLEGRHVVKTKDGVVLRFVPGKKHGQTIEIPIDDPDVQEMLISRKASAGPKGKLFGVSAQGLLDHVHSFDGGGFKTKDFRTHLGTKTALGEIVKLPVPNDPKQYKAAVKRVATVVSQKLGNTPAIALQSYINPVVFAQWQMQARIGGAGDAVFYDGDMDLPDAHWGAVGNALPNWRDAGDDDDADDDQLLAETPEDVVAMLGFDPLEFNETRDHLSLLDVHGLTVIVETPKGAARNGWSTPIAADYGYISRTGSGEGSAEQMDAFIGPEPDADKAYVIHQNNMHGDFDEHKVMLGFPDKDAAIAAYVGSYSPGQGDRIRKVETLSIPHLKRWLQVWKYALPNITDRQIAA